jgi:hypothetical protein
VSIDFGGVEQTFVLDAKGRATDRGDTFKLLPSPGAGLVTYDLKLKKGDFVADLADDGMDGLLDAKKEARNVLVRLVVGDVTYETATGVEYTG